MSRSLAIPAPCLAPVRPGSRQSEHVGILASIKGTFDQIGIPLHWVLVGLALAGIGYVVYARWSDRQSGAR